MRHAKFSPCRALLLAGIAIGSSGTSCFDSTGTNWPWNLDWNSLGLVNDGINGSGSGLPPDLGGDGAFPPIGGNPIGGGSFPPIGGGGSVPPIGGGGSIPPIGGDPGGSVPPIGGGSPGIPPGDPTPSPGDPIPPI